VDYIRIWWADILYEPCDCVCNFDVGFTFPDVAPGDYTLEVYFEYVLAFSENVTLE